MNQRVNEILKPIEHKIKVGFFALFKIFLKKGIKEFRPIDGKKLNKVLFLRPEKLGDLVISLPVFDGLTEHFPHIKISLLGSPRNYALIKDDKRFEKIYIYEKSFLKIIKVLIAMRRGNYDCVIDMIGDDSVTALFISQLTSRGKPRIGIGKTKFREYYDYNYAYRTNNTNHVIDNTLKLLEAFAIDLKTVSGFAEPSLTENDKKIADEYIDSLLSENNNTMLIGFNLSAGSRKRLWQREKSLELVKRLTEKYPDSKIVLFTPPNERFRAEKLKEKSEDTCYMIPDGLNLKQVSAIIRRLDIMISPDTSLVHIARAYRVAVVGLYTRHMKNYMLWRPYNQDEGAVVAISDDDIFDISVDQVYDTFVKVAALADRDGKLSSG